jgi:Zn-dependent metalloprotease
VRRRTSVKTLALLIVAAVVSAMAATSSAGATPADRSQDPTATAVAALVASKPAELLVSPHDVLFRVDTHEGTHGMRLFEYERTHRGLPVVGGDFVVATDAAGAVVNLAVAQEVVIDVQPTPAVSPVTALATARGEVALARAATAPRLAVLAWDVPRLVWEVEVDGADADGIPTAPVVYVDASSGEVTESYDRVQNAVGHGFYNGTVDIETSGSGTSFSMLDPTRPGIRCGGQNGATFTNSTNVWGNGSGTDLVTACVDVMYAVGQQWDMLGDWLNRNGIDGNGNGFPARVGWSAVNASWNGSNTNFGQTHDGLRQATPIDIVAHEYGHAIFQTTPGGSGSGGTGNEKGGLNEATSDIMGALTEAYADNPNDPPDFLVGEQADLVGTGPIRIMYDPSLHGHPGCWSTDIPTTSPVHAAGGPLNKWFYMVSEGSDPVGGPASPICPGGPSSVTGIGIIEAGQIFYNALLMKTTSWRYVNARQASMIAAVSMFGASSAQCTTVKAAWDAVSVPVLPNEPTCTAGPPPVTTIYQDSFETSTGWTRSGNATAGLWERGVPQATSHNGMAMQLSTVPHGSQVLVTGRLAGNSVGDHDVDDGVTIATSPLIPLPSSGNLTLSYEWYFAHLNNSSNDDFFRVSIISGGTTTVIANVNGSATNRVASWSTANLSLNQFAGQTVRIRIEVADNGTPSLVEGAVDNVRIISS